MTGLKETQVDVLIIGAGPAGLAAAIYTSRANKSTLVLKGKTPPRLSLAHAVENYPGIMSMSGKDMLSAFEKQAEHFGAQIRSGDALELMLDASPKMVTTRQDFIKAKTVILAIGRGMVAKSILNEENFIGRGVSYCANCDGAFFKGKKVFIYGKDQEALDDAMMLRDLGCYVGLILYCGKDRCDDNLFETASSRDIQVLENTEVLEVHGNSTLESITVKDTTSTREITADGLFIIQDVSSSSLLKKSGLELSNKDCIRINRSTHTSKPGVFAAGDITCGGLQVSVAVGEGVTASLEALKYLRESEV